jgi:hypothetical protein
VHLAKAFQATSFKLARQFAILLCIAVCTYPLAAQTVLLGDQTIESNLDSTSVGVAEAFPVTATSSGQVNSINFFLDESSGATKIYVGIYSDSSGTPGTLLTQGNTTQLFPGTWNSVTVSSATVTSGTAYWIAILGSTGGNPYFNDRSTTSCHSQTSSKSNLTSLPATWSKGSTWNTCFISAYAVSGTLPATAVIGNQAVESNLDKNPAQQAEAFPAIANMTGGVATINLYLDATSGAGPVYVGLYADNGNNHPGSLLGQGSTLTPVAGNWNPVSITLSNVTAGTRYWVAVLGTQATSPYFRDRQTTVCHSETSSQTTLTSLPATWRTGKTYSTCYISAYGVAASGSPILSISPSSISFNAIQGGANPASVSLSVTNTGSGTLIFTDSTDQPWLSVSPSSGTAPQMLQISATTGSLTPGTYTGHVTITGTGAQGSPATATVTFTVSPFVPPSISAAVSPAPDTYGWNNSAETVTFACAPGSYAVQTCSSPVKVGTQGANQPVTGTVTDVAGNTASTTVGVSIDLTTPVITAAASPAPNANGWNNTPVTVTFTCSDALSGIATCPAAQTVSTQGAGQIVSGTATDKAGNSASASLTLNISTTPPTITAAVVPPPNAAGWNNTSATVTFQCSGGVAPLQCPAPQVVNREGASQTILGQATDAAGNSASASVQVSLDKTPPQIVAIASPPPDAHGINTTGVTVTFNCSDAASGLAVCPGAITATTAGANQVVSGTAIDRAGNTSSASVTLNIQTTPLKIVPLVSPAPGAAGWNNSNVTVSFQCTGGAPPVQCPQPKVVSTEGANQSIAGTATDADGNSVTAAVSISLDKTPPILAIASPADGSNSPTAAVAVTGSVSDAFSGASGLTCNGAPAALSGPSFSCNVTLVAGNNAVVVAATDVAGNSVSLSRNLVFAIPIGLSITVPASLHLFSANPITVSGTVGDPTATVSVGGVVATVSNGTFTAQGVVLREGKNLLTASATSPAGGIGSDTVAVFLDTIPPTVHIDSPAAAAVVTTPQIDVTGNVNDVVSGTVNGDQVSVSVNGVAATVANRSFAAHGVLLVPGANTVTAIATDRAGNTARHEVQLTLQPATGQQTLTVISGNDQTAPINTQLPQPLVVQATDGIGRPIPNSSLNFAVLKSDGVLISGSQRGRTLAVHTDLNGNATVRFQVGSRIGVGSNQVAVGAPGFVGQAVFYADSTVGTPSQIFTVSGERQTGLVGAPLPEPMVAIVLDAGANPIPNVPVTFAVKSGGGLIGAQTSLVQNTDSDGKAYAVLTLGPQPGPNGNVVTASFSGLAGLPAVFTSSAAVPGPLANTTVSGTVFDDADHPIPNATASIKGTNLSALTNASGRFSIANAPVGNIVLFVDGSTSTDPVTYPTLSFQMATMPGVDNSLPNPVYLPVIDTGNSQVVGGDQDVLLTMSGVPGLQYKVFANSATFPDGSHVGAMTLSQVHADKVPMTPPNGTSPRLVGTLQPAGVKFDPPIQMTLPNTDGLVPGQVIELFSFHHDIEQFVTEGTARVSDDGSVIVSDPGFGLTVSGWHGGGGSPPPPNCVVNVFVSLDSAPDELNVDDQDSASATGTPSGTPPGCPATTPSYTWSSSAPSILDVSGMLNTATLMAMAEGSADISVDYQDAGVTATQQKTVPVVAVTLDCSNTALTRGDSTTCTVKHFPKGATFKWLFNGNDGGTVQETSTSNQWSGVIVQAGSVSVAVIKSDGTPVKKNPDPVTLTVSARSGPQWMMANPTPTDVGNCGVVDPDTKQSICLPVPPQPVHGLCGLDGSGTGCSAFNVGYAGSNTTVVPPHGPNSNYQYFASPPSMQVADGFFYNYELNPDVVNPQSQFYMAQCGDYPQNPNGFISGADLNTQNARHEYAGVQQSHYAFFISTFPAHDLLVFAEQQVMNPQADQNQFLTNVKAGLDSRIASIKSDTGSKGEPAAVNQTESGQPLGNINYGAPFNPTGYTACTPTITSLSPVSGKVNTPLTINGYNFGDIQVNGSTVTIGNQPPSVGSWSKNAVVITVPGNLKPGPAPVLISTPAGTSPAGNSFNVTP